MARQRLPAPAGRTLGGGQAVAWFVARTGVQQGRESTPQTHPAIAKCLVEALAHTEGVLPKPCITGSNPAEATTFDQLDLTVHPAPRLRIRPRVRKHPASPLVPRARTSSASTGPLSPEVTM